MTLPNFAVGEKVDAMSIVRVIDAAKTDALAELRTLREPLLLDRLILDDSSEAVTVRQIIADVRKGGDAAVAEITARVDGATVPPESLRVPREELVRARDRLPRDLLNTIRHAIGSVRQFQQHILSSNPGPLAGMGREVSIRTRPLGRIAVCTPGAAAPLPSSVIHCAVPAQVAGVKEIAVVAPPRHNNDIHPTILAVAHELGITEVYRMGGAQAIAALAIGTPQVRRVDKIVGPGSVYVQLAKRYLYGVVDIDMFAGPSEVVVVADATARAESVAADMLAQAEHDPGCSILLTDQPELVEKVLSQLELQLAQLTRREGASRALSQYGAIVLVKDMPEAVRLVNEIAPEHLELSTINPIRLSDGIDSAGAIFLGHYTPEAAGDYVAGPSHVLPTGGTARFWSGLSALDFLRRTSFIEYTPGGLAHHASVIEQFARAEGLDGHARSVSIRTQPPGK
jgi:histidinol dehydrogenase